MTCKFYVTLQFLTWAIILYILQLVFGMPHKEKTEFMKLAHAKEQI